jgi:hypothetical protein
MIASHSMSYVGLTYHLPGPIKSILDDPEPLFENRIAFARDK